MKNIFEIDPNRDHCLNTSAKEVLKYVIPEAAEGNKVNIHFKARDGEPIYLAGLKCPENLHGSIVFEGDVQCSGSIDARFIDVVVNGDANISLGIKANSVKVDGDLFTGIYDVNVMEDVDVTGKLICGDVAGFETTLSCGEGSSLANMRLVRRLRIEGVVQN